MNQYDSQKSVFGILECPGNNYATINRHPSPYLKQAKSVGGGVFKVMPRIQFSHKYHNIISLENLLEAWKEFVKEKRKRKDVQQFERDLMANIISLHHDLAEKRYQHRAYEAFKISD